MPQPNDLSRSLVALLTSPAPADRRESAGIFAYTPGVHC
jgi:hypothetical protein